MRHANLPIEIIIKRYLWPERESPRRTERGTRGTREGAHLPPSVPPRVLQPPTYKTLAAPAPFASPSAYNIRCAKIGKSAGTREAGERGEQRRVQRRGQGRRMELEDRRSGGKERKRRRMREYRCTLVGQTIYTAYEIYRKAS